MIAPHQRAMPEGAALAAVHARMAAAGLAPDQYGCVILRPGADGAVEMARHRGAWRVYPCSLVKAFHLVHALAALDEGRIEGHPELDRAMADMIAWSSNTATNYVIDILTGTTGDTLLHGAALADWTDRREALNRFYRALGWPEFDGCTISQKLMDDVRYGREAQYAGQDGARLNVLTPNAAARLLWELFEGGLPLTPAARTRAQMTLWRDPAGKDAPRPDYQLRGYLGGALPAGVEVWSKAGHNLWTGDPKSSWFKHDMIRMSAPGRAPVILVLMTCGERAAAGAEDLFPEIGRQVWDLTADAGALLPGPNADDR